MKGDAETLRGYVTCTRVMGPEITLKIVTVGRMVGSTVVIVDELLVWLQLKSHYRRTRSG